MKKIQIVFVVAAVLLLSSTFLIYTKMESPEGETIAQSALQRKEISLSSGIKLSVMVAQNNSERILGLSGYPGLSKNEGMLFVFDELGKQPIWMKDMLFSLDILWFNERYELVHIVENATPDSYPTNIFASNEDALYVLEVPEGFVAENKIKLGDTFSFK